MNNSINLPSIFVVDDEPIVRRAVMQSLEELECQVSGFESAIECLETLKTSACNLIITDINMPGMDGVELLEEVKRSYPAIPVLVVTGYGEIPLAVRAVKLGALDFLEKPLCEEILLPMVQEVLRKSYRSRTHELKPLSEAELKVLRLIAQGKSNKEIAFELDRSIRTVENHRHHLMKKLQVQSAGELIRVALELGILSATGS